MLTKVGKFTFAIPEGHPNAGQKVEKAFEYPETESDAEAVGVMAEKKWSLKTQVNDVLKANARSNAYQAALLPYRPSEVSQEEIQERMIRDFIRMGFSETKARTLMQEALASQTTETQETTVSE